MTKSISKVLTRHLEQLRKEINAYKDENDLWLKAGEIPNSAGNLCLHLCGNLQHFIGTVLGNSDYVRHRDDEFGLQNVPRKELLSEIDNTIQVVTQTLSELDESTLKHNYPIDVFGEKMTTEFFLIHLTSHFGYHLGQLNYHRRLLAVK